MAEPLKFIILCGDERSVYVPIYRRLLEITRHTCVGIAIVPFISPAKRVMFVTFLLRFYGVTGFARRVIATALKKASLPSADTLGNLRQIPVRRFSEPNAADCVRWIGEKTPDVILASQSFKIK